MKIALIFGILLSQNYAMDYLSDHLKPFETFIGKTYKGEFSNSTPEKPVIDIQTWVRALNGNGVRVIHSVNDGEYGGESMIMWDLKQESLVAWYFTTAGFYTQAMVVYEDYKFFIIEKVTGNENGITEVKSTINQLLNGNLHTKSQYLINGVWNDGHEIYYKEDSDSKVIFK